MSIQQMPVKYGTTTIHSKYFFFHSKNSFTSIKSLPNDRLGMGGIPGTRGFQ